MTNIVFIKGAKQSVVDFINRGLKGCKSKVHILADMTGEQIADRLNGHGCPITIHSYLPMPATFFHYNTTEGPLCFSEWYLWGCHDKSDDYDQDLFHARWQEMYDFLKAHPERFIADEDGHYKCADADKTLKDLHPELIDAYRKYLHRYACAASYQKRKYGVIGWEEWCMEHYGCPENAPLDIWKLKYETPGELCLSFQLIDASDYPVSFLKFINGFEGIAIYAYGFAEHYCPSWFQYNGLKDELVWKSDDDDSVLMADSEASYKVLEGYVKEFLKELAVPI